MIVCLWYWEFFNAPAYFHLIHILVKDFLDTKIYAPNTVRVISNQNFEIEPLSLQLCEQFFLADISVYKDQLLLGCTTILNANFITSGLLVMIVVLAFGYLSGYFICIPAFYMRKIKDKKFLQIINILKKHNRI